MTRVSWRTLVEAYLYDVRAVAVVQSDSFISPPLRGDTEIVIGGGVPV